MVVKPDVGPPSYVSKWERHLGCNFDIVEYTKIWSATKSSFPYVVEVEANYKVLARWYLVLARIVKYVPGYSNNCFHGCVAQAPTCIYGGIVQWYKNLWKAIFALALEIFESPIQPDPSITLLNLNPLTLTHSQFKIFVPRLTAAKQTVARAWNSSSLLVAEAKHRIDLALIWAKIETNHKNKFRQFDRI